MFLLFNYGRQDSTINTQITRLKILAKAKPSVDAIIISLLNL